MCGSHVTHRQKPHFLGYNLLIVESIYSLFMFIDSLVIVYRPYCTYVRICTVQSAWYSRFFFGRNAVLCLYSEESIGIFCTSVPVGSVTQLILLSIQGVHTVTKTKAPRASGTGTPSSRLP